MLLTFPSTPADSGSFLDAEQKFLNDLKQNIIVTQSKLIDERSQTEDVWPGLTPMGSTYSAQHTRGYTPVREFNRNQQRDNSNLNMNISQPQKQPAKPVTPARIEPSPNPAFPSTGKDSGKSAMPREVVALNTGPGSAGPRRKLSGRSCTVDASKPAKRPDVNAILSYGEAQQPVHSIQLEMVMPDRSESAPCEPEKRLLDSEHERQYHNHLPTQNRPLNRQTNMQTNAPNRANASSATPHVTHLDTTTRQYPNVRATRLRKRSASADLANSPDLLASLKAVHPTSPLLQKRGGEQARSVKPLPKQPNTNSNPSSPRQLNPTHTNQKGIPEKSCHSSENQAASRAEYVQLLRPGEKEFSTLFYAVKECFMLLLRLVATFVKTSEVKVIIELGMMVVIFLSVDALGAALKDLLALQTSISIFNKQRDFPVNVRLNSRVCYLFCSNYLRVLIPRC